jgi:serine/threonine protein kinase
VTYERYCPLCDEGLSLLKCPQHNVPTVMLTETPFPLVPMPGTVFAGRYVIERVLGEGGMGLVFSAIQETTKQRVALKIMRPDPAGMRAGLRFFYREAHAMSLVEHPNVVRILDFGLDEGMHLPFLVMAMAHGRTLKDVLERGPMSEQRACRILAQVAAALVPTHAKNIVHRDLKPENILVQRLATNTEHAIVLDFGVARLHDENIARASTTGGLVGTVAYMSPEQARGSCVDVQSDLYSLGCILHECLTGRPLFDDPNPMRALYLRVESEAPELSDLLCDGRAPTQGLLELRRSLVAQRTEERPSSALVVHEVLDHLGKGDSEAALKILQLPRDYALQVHRATLSVPPHDTGTASESIDIKIPSLAPPGSRQREQSESTSDKAVLGVSEPNITSRMTSDFEGFEPTAGATMIPERETPTPGRAGEELSGVFVRLPAAVDEYFEHKTYAHRLRGVDVIVFDFDEVTRLTSLGIQEWSKLLRALAHTTYYCFIRCHSNAVSQMNWLADFVGNGEILSVFAPYICPNCNAEIELFVDVIAEKERIAADSLPPLRCPACRIDAELDDAAYFERINRSPPPKPHPLALKLLPDLVPRRQSLNRSLRGRPNSGADRNGPKW